LVLFAPGLTERVRCPLAALPRAVDVLPARIASLALALHPPLSSGADAALLPREPPAPPARVTAGAGLPLSARGADRFGNAAGASADTRVIARLATSAGRRASAALDGANVSVGPAVVLAPGAAPGSFDGLVTPKVAGRGAVHAALSVAGELTATYYATPAMGPAGAVAAGAWYGALDGRGSGLLGNRTGHGLPAGGAARFAGFLRPPGPGGAEVPPPPPSY